MSSPGAGPVDPAGRPAPAGRPSGRVVSLEREASLRRRLLARDERALAELIDLTTPWLLGVTQGMLSDAAEAEEVVMESFAIVWNRIELIEHQPAGLMPWLLRIARNRAIDRLRARRRRRLKLLRATAFGVIGEEPVPAQLPNEAALPGWHVHRAVHRALEGLPDEQRAAVRLAFFEGLSHSEIAEQLAIPMGTVKTRLRLAFGKLRGALAPIKEWIE